MVSVIPVDDSNLATARFGHNRALSRSSVAGRRAMASLCRLIAIGYLLVAFGADAQAGASRRGVVLPSPQLIHCRSAECSQLWKNTSGEAAVYPAQVLTDVVHGEVVGLTAVYDKSVSIEELRFAIDALCPNPDPKDVMDGSMWRDQAEQIVIQLHERKDGTKQLIYLKIVRPGDAGSLVPSAHINSVK
jgi:hypothetical protein